MELKLVIDDRIVAGARRLCTRRRVLVLLALTALSSAAAIAAPLGEAPFKFKEGQVVSSSQFNANFQALTDAIDAVDARFGTSFSVSPTSGFVGIGTKKPTSWLHVAAPSPAPALVTTHLGGSGPDLVTWVGEDLDLGVVDSETGAYTELMILRLAGSGGVKTAFFPGNVDTDTIHAATVNANNVHAEGVYAKGVQLTSDARLKMDIAPLEHALDRVLALRGVSFRWRDLPWGPANIGLIAQEVEQVFPELVREDADGYRSVAYANLVAVLVESTKAQQVQIDALAALLERQHSDVERLRDEVEILRQNVGRAFVASRAAGFGPSAGELQAVKRLMRVVAPCNVGECPSPCVLGRRFQEPRGEQDARAVRTRRKGSTTLAGRLEGSDAKPTEGSIELGASRARTIDHRRGGTRVHSPR